MSGVAERVAAGAALLDQKEPGWWRDDATRPINLARLSMEDCKECVLGQLHGDYADGLDAIGAPADDPSEIGYGFNLPFAAPDEDFWPLTDEWRRVIAGRREQAKAGVS